MPDAAGTGHRAAPRLFVHEPDALAGAAARWLAEALARAIAEGGRATIALAGGTTPRPVYEALTGQLAARVAWDRVHVYFGDERAVAPDDPASNYRMARETLLDRVPIPPAQVHRMEAERADRAAAADAYAGLLPGRLEVLVLGMGPDGHTVSLFPRSTAMDEQERRVLPVIGPKAPAARLTITPPVIAAAREVVVIAAGADKAAAAARAIDGVWAPRDVPIQLARRGTWFLDRAAAAALGSPRG